MKTEWHSVFLSRLINILSAKACRSAKQDELCSCCKTEQEAALLGVSGACKCDSYWPYFSNRTLIHWIFLVFSFYLIVFLGLPVWFLHSNSARLHWVWKSWKWIKRACFFRDLPWHEGGNHGLPWLRGVAVWFLMFCSIRHHRDAAAAGAGFGDGETLLEDGFNGPFLQ